MSVFTRAWVTENLAEFLDGRNASAIVTLGKEAIDAKEEEERLLSEVTDLVKEVTDAETKKADLARKVEKVAREVQDLVVSQLRPFNYEQYTRNRYSINVVQQMLRDYKGDFPDQNQYADALTRLGQGALDSVPELTPLPGGIDGILTSLSVALSETPVRVALDALEDQPDAQTWVERGMVLHEGLAHCLYCAGPITPGRMEDLAAHFDQSWRELRTRANDLRIMVSNYRSALAGWVDRLPDEHALAVDLRDAYRDQVDAIRQDVEVRLTLLASIEVLAAQKVDDPSATPNLPDWALLAAPIRTAAVLGAVSEHNQQAADHAAITEANLTAVLDHLIGSKAEVFRDLEQQHRAVSEKRQTAFAASNLAQRTLEEVRRKKFSSHEMAETLTKDLGRVYGKNHLSVQVIADGKSYACKRGDAPADHLSDGERTTLSLLYFLRKLQDESDTTAPEQRIVVIDDPTSSLDREAVFATHQWLNDTLRDFGQFVVLTHDFNLLRLFIKSQKNQWDRASTKIRGGDAEEKRFPRAAFLEMYASAESGSRTTQVAALPEMLRNNVSEYAYLFSMVMKGVADPSDTERLFLLPNAARRVLEVFCSYKAPHRTQFDQQLEVLIETSGEAYRDVYDFCNRFSHGEGNESIDVLDARTVHQQIRRCMEFLKNVDRDHFDRMCKATRSDEGVV